MVKCPEEHRDARQRNAVQLISALKIRRVHSVEILQKGDAALGSCEESTLASDTRMRGRSSVGEPDVLWSGRSAVPQLLKRTVCASFSAPFR